MEDATAHAGSQSTDVLADAVETVRAGPRAREQDCRARSRSRHSQLRSAARLLALFVRRCELREQRFVVKGQRRQLPRFDVALSRVMINQLIGVRQVSLRRDLDGGKGGIVSRRLAELLLHRIELCSFGVAADHVDLVEQPGLGHEQQVLE